MEGRDAESRSVTVVSIKNLLRDEILNLGALSGRCDRAREDELRPLATILSFSLGFGEWYQGKGLVGSPFSTLLQQFRFSHSPLENLPVLLVKKHLSFYSYFLLTQEEDLQSWGHTGKAQLSGFTWRPLKRKKGLKAGLDAKIFLNFSDFCFIMAVAKGLTDQRFWTLQHILQEPWVTDSRERWLFIAFWR